MWPQRVLESHACVTYVAGIAAPCYLALRYLPAARAYVGLPISFGVIKPILLSLLALGMLAVEIPILRLGGMVGKNYDHLRRMVLMSGVTDAVLVTTDINIAPHYLRCIPFLLFSDPEIIKRRLFFVTEWHLLEPHWSRIAAVTDPSLSHYTADFDMEQGLVSIHLTSKPR